MVNFLVVTTDKAITIIRSVFIAQNHIPSYKREALYSLAAERASPSLFMKAPYSNFMPSSP